MYISSSNTSTIDMLKDILLGINHQTHIESFINHMESYLQDVSTVELHTQILELKYGNYGITSEDILLFFKYFQEIHRDKLHTFSIPNRSNHPARILLDENKALLDVLLKIDKILSTIVTDTTNLNSQTINKLQEKMKKLGHFYRHYNRKEKVYFPIMERYKQYIFPRVMWGNDDVVRTLFKGTQRMLENITQIDPIIIKRSFASLASKMKENIFDEEHLLLPIVLEIFTEDDWQQIELESSAFGYALMDVDSKEDFGYKNLLEETVTTKVTQQHLPFGGGYLTIKEANIILDHLPLEITFIDEHGIFKYFNNKTNAADMMFIRTPISIGRHVSNCHPPKSMGKVMRLIRDLKSGRRTSETMWFKKKDKYIHITYKPVFDKDNRFVGILEYVQDIQEFFELPRETKRELLSLDD